MVLVEGKVLAKSLEFTVARWALSHNFTNMLNISPLIRRELQNILQFRKSVHHHLASHRCATGYCPLHLVTDTAALVQLYSQLVGT